MTLSGFVLLVYSSNIFLEKSYLVVIYKRKTKVQQRPQQQLLLFHCVVHAQKCEQVLLYGKHLGPLPCRMLLLTGDSIYFIL